MIEISDDNFLPQSVREDLELFIISTEEAWRNAGLIKKNSFGVAICFATRPHGDFTDRVDLEFGVSRPEAEHDRDWYIHNAHRKNLVCLQTGLDSLAAVRLFPGTTANIDGAFPWGGAVIDTRYGIIVGTSGFKEDEDNLFSNVVMGRLKMLMDRIGETRLEEARSRARLARPGFNRFTELPER